MRDANYNTTSQLTGDTSPDTYRVLLRDRIRVNTTDYSLSGSWYSYTATVDLGQYQYSILPMVEAYVNNGTLYKMPCTLVSSSGAITYNYYVSYSIGSKFGGESTKIDFNVGGTAALQLDIYYQVMSLPAGGSLFP